MVYYYCLVPKCKSTTVATPLKTFISVPKEEKQRKIWLKAARRDPKDVSAKSQLWICEDHFNLEKDMENFMEWKMMGVQKRMKKSTVPHIFACQNRLKRTIDIPVTDMVLKRTRQDSIQNVLRDEPSTSKCHLVQKDFIEQTEESVTDSSSYTSVGIPVNFKKDLIKQTEESVTDSSSYTSVGIQVNLKEDLIEQTEESVTDSSSYTSVGVQVNLKPKFRSKSLQCNIRLATVSQSCSPIKQCTTTSIGLSPIKVSIGKNIYTSSESGESHNMVSEELSIATSLGTSSASLGSSNLEFESVLENEQCQTVSLKNTINKIENNPRLYLGLMKEVLYTIELIQEFSQLDTTSIYLTLQKIRLNRTFAELGDDFGLSESSASRIFSKSVGPISQVLKDLITWLPIASVRENLPVPFRARYNNVYAIIDCLEIEVQKPEDPIKQALTWSEYKKANTIKYLVSSTPDGIINFISDGFGGRTSDTIIFKNSGFLNKLQPNMHIMADRGFKHIDQMLTEKQCVLVRPPSVASGQKLTKLEALETKKIASLRIHIERVIRRLREFKMLKPHACTHIGLIPHLDSIINIAGGLVNTQGPIISGK